MAHPLIPEVLEVALEELEGQIIEVLFLDHIASGGTDVQDLMSCVVWGMLESYTDVSITVATWVSADSAAINTERFILIRPAIMSIRGLGPALNPLPI
jgi:hypothetical protein